MERKSKKEKKKAWILFLFLCITVNGSCFDFCRSCKKKQPLVIKKNDNYLVDQFTKSVNYKHLNRCAEKISSNANQEKKAEDIVTVGIVKSLLTPINKIVGHITILDEETMTETVWEENANFKICYDCTTKTLACLLFHPMDKTILSHDVFAIDLPMSFSYQDQIYIFERFTILPVTLKRFCTFIDVMEISKAKCFFTWDDIGLVYQNPLRPVEKVTAALKFLHKSAQFQEFEGKSIECEPFLLKKMEDFIPQDMRNITYTKSHNDENYTAIQIHNYITELYKRVEKNKIIMDPNRSNSAVRLFINPLLFDMIMDFVDRDTLYRLLFLDRNTNVQVKHIILKTLQKTKDIDSVETFFAEIFTDAWIDAETSDVGFLLDGADHKSLQIISLMKVYQDFRNGKDIDEIQVCKSLKIEIKNYKKLHFRISYNFRTNILNCLLLNDPILPIDLKHSTFYDIRIPKTMMINVNEKKSGKYTLKGFEIRSMTKEQGIGFGFDEDFESNWNLILNPKYLLVWMDIYVVYESLTVPKNYHTETIQNFF